MNVLDASISTALDADSGAGGVAALATGGTFQLDAPQGTVPPYVIWQEASDFPGYAFANTLKYDHVFYMLRAFAVDDPNTTHESGPLTAGKIADRLKALLTNPSLSVSGKTLLSARFDRSYPPLKEWDAANNRYVYSRGILCEVWVS